MFASETKSNTTAANLNANPTGSAALIKTQRYSDTLSRLINPSGASYLSGKLIIQPKLTVNSPNDVYEQEADSTADKVMAMPDHSGLVQRKCKECEEEDKGIQKKSLGSEISRVQRREDEEETVQSKSLLQLQKEEEQEQVQTKSLGEGIIWRKEDEEEETVQSKLIQRKGAEEDEEAPVQAKTLIQKKCDECKEEDEKQTIMRKANDGGQAVSSDIVSTLSGTKGGGTSLNGNTKTFMESRFGNDFSDVRIHTGGDAVQMSKNLNAQAFTHGNDIYFNSGKYDTGTSTGKHLLAHELTHTIQQTGGVRNKLQRTIGNRLDLTSPRFKGDEQLEAALDNEKLIRIGQTGEHVKKFQKAMVDSGISMPISTKPSGEMDGIFGPETKRSVQQFQRDLGFDFANQDGIIGPITMSHMDSLYPTENPSRPDKGCKNETREITVDLLVFPNITRDIDADFTFANEVFKDCCVKFVVKKREDLKQDFADATIGSDGILEMGNDCDNPDAELTGMITKATTDFGLTSKLKVFYLDKMNPRNQGSTISEMCAASNTSIKNVIIVETPADRRTLAHEFGHAMINAIGEHNVTTDNIMHISQGSTGTDKVARLQCDIVFARAGIQPKLEVGEPDDEYEKEADAMADTVMSKPDPNITQRKTEDDEEEKLQTRPEIQTKCKECEEEEKVQRKAYKNADKINIQRKQQSTTRDTSPEGFASRLIPLVIERIQVIEHAIQNGGIWRDEESPAVVTSIREQYGWVRSAMLQIFIGILRDLQAGLRDRSAFPMLQEVLGSSTGTFQHRVGDADTDMDVLYFTVLYFLEDGGYGGVEAFRLPYLEIPGMGTPVHIEIYLADPIRFGVLPNEPAGRPPVQESPPQRGPLCSELGRATGYVINISTLPMLDVRYDGRDRFVCVPGRGRVNLRELGTSVELIRTGVHGKEEAGSIPLSTDVQYGNLEHEADSMADNVMAMREPLIHKKQDTEEEEVQRDLLDDIGGAAGEAWEATGGAVTEAASGLFWDTLEEYAPQAVPVIREISTKGIIGFLYDKLKGAFSNIFKNLGLEGTAIDSVIEMYKGLMEQAMIIVGALAAGDCQPLFTAIDEMKTMVQQMASEAWEAITTFLQPVGDFFSDLWTNFGAPVIDWISEVAGDVWDFIKGIGKQIWDWTQPIRDTFSDAWDWIKEQLGLNDSEGGDEGGIMSWVSEQANKAWESIKLVLEPVIAPIRAVYDKVMEILPMEAIMNLRQTVTEWLNKVASMANAMGQDAGAVAEEQTSLRDEILPAVMISINNFRDNLISAGSWVSEKIGSLAASFTGFMDGLASNELLSPAAGAIQWLNDKVNTLSQWAQTTVTGLFKWIGDGLVYLSKFIEPILNALQKIADVLGNLLGKLPDFLMGPIWWILPECIKNPIKDFFLNVIVKNIPIIGDIVTALPDIWAKIKNTVMKILRQIFVDGNILGALWTYYSALLEVFGIPPQLVVGILAKAATAFADIISNPIGFMLNLLKALKDGFVKFFSNIGKNLLTGFADWLFGEVAEAGLTVPPDFSFKSVFNFILQILDITLDRIFKRMEEHPKIGPAIVKKLRSVVNFLTGAWEWVAVLINDGPSGLWKYIQEKLSDLWQNIISSVIGWITQKVIEKATVWLLSLLDVTGIMPVINSLVAIYKAIESFFQYLKEMLEIVNTVLDGIVGIAKGATEIAAGFVEKALVKSIPIVLGFLANQFGLGKLSKKIKEMVENIRKKVDSAIDWLLDKAINIGSSILNALKKGAAAVKKGVKSLIEWWKEKREFKTKTGHSHTLSFKGEGKNAELMLASDVPKTAEERLLAAKEKNPGEAASIDSALKEVKAIRKKISEVQTPKDEKDKSTVGNEEITAELDELQKILMKCNIDGKEIPLTDVRYEMKNGLASKVIAKPLTKFSGNTKGTKPSDSSLKQAWEHIKLIDFEATNPKKPDEKRPRFWRAGHLLSEHVHGPGVDWNLVPLVEKDNSFMKNNWEEDIKNEVLKGEDEFFFEATVEQYYKAETGKEYLQYFPQRITGKWGKAAKEVDGKKIEGTEITLPELGPGKPKDAVASTEPTTINLTKISRRELHETYNIGTDAAKRIASALENKPLLKMLEAMKEYYDERSKRNDNEAKKLYNNPKEKVINDKQEILSAIKSNKEKTPSVIIEVDDSIA